MTKEKRDDDFWVDAGNFVDGFVIDRSLAKPIYGADVLEEDEALEDVEDEGEDE